MAGKVVNINAVDSEPAARVEGDMLVLDGFRERDPQVVALVREGAPMDITGGERLDTLERVIVSPVAGIFSPLPDQPSTIAVGAPLGYVQAGTETFVVVSPFAGELVDVVAVAGERLGPFQRVAWLRAA